MRKRRICFGALAACAVVACGADSLSSSGFNADSPAPGRDGAGGPSANGGSTSPPPEKEVESDYEAPVATGNFVWIANPKSGRVAYVDAATLQVRTVEAGNGPTYVAGVPGQADDATLVINVLSDDATLLRATKDGITTKTFPIADLANSIAFSADGRFAITWADVRKVSPAPPEAQGFQDITLLDLTSGASTVLAVGYRPVAVGFASKGARAYAVSQDGVAIVDLAGAPLVKKNVPVSDTPNEDPGSRDVSVTPDGTLALIRRDDQAAITLVSLDTDARATVTLPGPVTDLDLSDKGDRAVAVIRSTSQAAVLPVPDIFTAPSSFVTVTIAGETFGSVVLAPGGGKGLLYTNALPVERLTILDLSVAPPPFRTVRLYSPVLAAFPSPDGAHAVILHDMSAATSTSSASPGAFSLVPIAGTLPAKIVATSAPPTSVAVTATSAVVAERDDKKAVYGAYLARFPQLSVERYPLASPPIAAGVVPSANRAFVAQVHPEGRVTFFDLDTGAARTLTGFELSSRVVDGSTP